MKTLVSNLWVWIVAHPPESLAALSALLYLVLNVVNARVPVEKRQSSVWYKILDALAIATQKGSESRASWPVVGRSIAKDVAAVVVPKPEEPPARDNAGFAMLSVLGAIALAAVLGLVLSGCPMPAPDGCTPLDRRCHEDTPQVCSPGQRWTPADVRCGTVGAVCTIADGGAPSCLPGGAQ